MNFLANLIYMYVCVYIYVHISWLYVNLIRKTYKDIGEGNGNPLQYSCLENPTGRGAW